MKLQMLTDEDLNKGVIKMHRKCGDICYFDSSLNFSAVNAGLYMQQLNLREGEI